MEPRRHGGSRRGGSGIRGDHCHAIEANMPARIPLTLFFGSLLAKTSVAQQDSRAPSQGTAQHQQVASFEHQVSGVTISRDGRIFVNFPRWTEDAPISVPQVTSDGKIKAYPDEEWNSWRNARRTRCHREITSYASRERCGRCKRQSLPTDGLWFHRAGG